MLRLFRSSPLVLLCVLAGCETPTRPNFSDDASATETKDSGTKDAGPMADGGRDLPDASTDAGKDAGVDAGPMPGLDARLENLTCTAAMLGDPPPALLSATGCLQADAPSQPVPALIPFELNAALWSDG